MSRLSDILAQVPGIAIAAVVFYLSNRAKVLSLAAELRAVARHAVELAAELRELRAIKADREPAPASAAWSASRPDRTTDDTTPFGRPIAAGRACNYDGPGPCPAGCKPVATPFTFLPLHLDGTVGVET